MKVVTALTLLFCAGGMLAAADPYQWEMAGPGGGGRFTQPGLSADGKSMLCGSDMGNAFYGETATGAMRMIPQKRFSFTAGDGFFFNPGKPGTVYAAGTLRGLRRSADGGRNWEAVTLPIEKLEWNGSWPPPYSGPMLCSFAGNDGVLVYFRYEKSGRNPVFATRDGGENWTLAAMLPPESGRPHSLLALPGGGALVAQEDALRKLSPDGSVEPVFTPQDGELAGLVKQGNLFYLAVNAKAGAEVLKSADGKTFEPCLSLGKGTRVRYFRGGEGTHPAVYFSMTVPGGVTVENPLGATLFRSADGFQSFQPVLFRNPGNPKFNMSERQWTATAWGWQVLPQGLAVAADNADAVMCTDATQAYLSLDGGKSWKPLAAPAADSGEAVLTAGSMAVMSAYGYCFDPNNRDNRFIAMNDFSNWGSFDGGKSWRQYEEGNLYPHNVYAMLYDDKVPGKLWAGASKDHDLPHWKWQNSRNKLTNLGGLILSEDGGRHWKTIDAKESGLPVGTITGLAMDPASKPAARTLFAAVYGKGVYRSSDGGLHWSESSNGISKWDRLLFGLTRDNFGRLWTVGTIRLPGMLYLSADNGEHWTKIFQDKEFGYLTRVAVHPSDPNTVYLSAFSTRPFHDSDGGIRKSTDGGKSWKTVFPGKACWGVYLHPTHPDTVFAATYDKGVFRSTDGGATWEELEDYPAPSPISITFDPENPDILYVCNFGGSVYRGVMK